jgi:hypothetical protein
MTHNGFGAHLGCLGDEFSAAGTGVDLAHRFAGLMSSLSNPGEGCDPSQKRRAVSSRPTRPGQRQGGALAMTRLAGVIDGVIGVDTRRDTLAAAVTDMMGGLLAQTSVRADGAGYRQLFGSPGRRSPVGGAGRWRAPAATAPG